MARAIVAATALLALVFGGNTVSAAGAASAQETSAAKSVNEFGIDLYERLALECSDNVFFSPFSIETALAMTYAGARGETAGEMAAVLHLDAESERVHPAFAELIGRINKQAVSGSCKLATANALWGQKGHGFLKSFLQLVSENYGAGMEFVDFGRSEEARAKINDWTAKKTQDRIKDLIPAGAINADTRLVLTNAVYFKGLWVAPFKKRDTRQARFKLMGGQSVVVPTMCQGEDFRYGDRPGYQAIEMPYKGCDIAMLVLLPTDPAGLPGLEKALTLDEVDKCVAGLATRTVALQLPKAHMLQRFSLAKTLGAMGMPNAFADADFSGMDGAKDLFISEVLHKAFVNVDEEGTEAAAATSVMMALGEAPMEEIKQFIADHPFIFLIRERQSGAILFMGRVMNPELADE